MFNEHSIGVEQREDSLATSMHNRFFHALNILHAFRACILKAGLLLYRQRIDIGAQQDGLAFAILKHGCQPMTANVRVDLKSVERLKVLDDGGCGLFFAE